MAGIDVGFAEETAARVVEHLDAYATALGRGGLDACEAHHVERTQTAGQLAVREACLASRRHAMDELVRVLLDPDRDVVTSAVTATMELPDVDACSDLDALRREVELPVDPDTRATVGGASSRGGPARRPCSTVGGPRPRWSSSTRLAGGSKTSVSSPSKRSCSW